MQGDVRTDRCLGVASVRLIGRIEGRGWDDELKEGFRADVFNAPAVMKM